MGDENGRDEALDGEDQNHQTVHRGNTGGKKREIGSDNWTNHQIIMPNLRDEEHARNTLGAQVEVDLSVSSVTVLGTALQQGLRQGLKS